MLLTAISTDRHLHPGIDQANIALIRCHLHPFINEVEIDLYSSAEGSLSQVDDSLNTCMRRGCG